ncbi:amidohydrolase family protein [Advenella mimigardefordensis]|nr:amidohydrolase family protein [Advenella mimigardefordensis]
MPKHSCDCHMHVFDNTYPIAKNAILVHEEATLVAYKKLQTRLNIEKNVIVQPSTYGTDNRLLVNTISNIGESCRGIAVVDSSVTDETLYQLKSAGVVGVRFNLVQQGATTMDMIETIAKRIHPYGMHIQLHLKPSDLIAIEKMLMNLPVPVVLDHFANIGAQIELEKPAKESVYRLMSTGNTWIKLSGAYMVSRVKNYSDLQEYAEKLMESATDRLVWGSDWPHATEKRKPNDGDLISLLGLWAKDAVTIRKILVDNPVNLYGFKPVE